MAKQVLFASAHLGVSNKNRQLPTAWTKVMSHTTPSPQWQHHQIEEALIGKTISAPECKMSHHHF